MTNPPSDPFERVTTPWDWDQFLKGSQDPAICNICSWSGASFTGSLHCESALCPECGSIARDRFLFFCFVERVPPGQYRILETSPRLGGDYRSAMKRWFEYSASDFDLRSHRADLQIDLQDMDLEGGSIDVFLTPHVLEHVPNTDQALGEIYRVLAPGGKVFIQVPILQGRTARPTTPEFHGDNTPVEWRFGFDFTERIRQQGFETQILCTEGFYGHVENGAPSWPDPCSPEFDVEDMLKAARVEDLQPVANEEVTRRLSLWPSYMFLTWEGTKIE